MSIDIARIATHMIKKGHTPPRIANDEMDGWTNDLMDILEEIYQIETQVREAIEAQDTASIILKVTPYEMGVLRTTLEEEIDRNASDYPDINGACGSILEQLRKAEKIKRCKECGITLMEPEEIEDGYCAQCQAVIDDKKGIRT